MRVVFFISGIAFVVLAALGAVLPLLPTTPFLLLAVSCFFRSSPRCAQWLVRSPWIGPMLHDWHRHGTVRPKTKAAAIGSMLLFGGTTLVVGGFTWIINATLLATMTFASGIVLRLPSAQR